MNKKIEVGSPPEADLPRARQEARKSVKRWAFILAGSGLQSEPKHLGSINMIEPAKVVEVAEGFSLPL